MGNRKKLIDNSVIGGEYYYSTEYYVKKYINSIFFRLSSILFSLKTSDPEKIWTFDKKIRSSLRRNDEKDIIYNSGLSSVAAQARPEGKHRKIIQIACSSDGALPYHDGR